MLKKKKKKKVFKVGLIGARGHTGLELLKQIERHPYLAVTIASSRAMKGKSIKELLPESQSDLHFVDLNPKDLVQHSAALDLWILAMPNERSKDYLEFFSPNRFTLPLFSFEPN